MRMWVAWAFQLMALGSVIRCVWIAPDRPITAITWILAVIAILLARMVFALDFPPDPPKRDGVLWVFCEEERAGRNDN